MSNNNPATVQLENYQFISGWKKTGKPRKTVRVRIPEDLVEQVMAYAKQLDEQA